MLVVIWFLYEQTPLNNPASPSIRHQTTHFSDVNTNDQPSIRSPSHIKQETVDANNDLQNNLLPPIHEGTTPNSREKEPILAPPQMVM